VKDYHNDGVAVVPNFVPGAAADEMIAAMTRMIEARQPSAACPARPRCYTW
jgi:hypothetical protein